MLATTLSSHGIDRSQLMTALLRALGNIIQSLFSAPFKRVIKNSVTEKASRDADTTDDNFWIQWFRRRISKVRKSISFCWSPMPTQATYISRSRLEPPTIDTMWNCGIHSTGKSVYHRYKQTLEDFSVSVACEHPGLRTSRFEFNTEELLSNLPVHSKTQDAWKHPIQDDWPKHKQVKTREKWKYYVCFPELTSTSSHNQTAWMSTRLAVGTTWHQSLFTSS